MLSLFLLDFHVYGSRMIAFSFAWTQPDYSVHVPPELRRRCVALRGRIREEKARQENLLNTIQILEREEKELKIANQTLLLQVVMAMITGYSSAGVVSHGVRKSVY